MKKRHDKVKLLKPLKKTWDLGNSKLWTLILSSDIYWLLLHKFVLGQDFKISFISFALSATLDQKPILNFSKLYVHSLEAPTFIFWWSFIYQCCFVILVLPESKKKYYMYTEYKRHKQAQGHNDKENSGATVPMV